MFTLGVPILRYLPTVRQMSNFHTEMDAAAIAITIQRTSVIVQSYYTQYSATPLNGYQLVHPFRGPDQKPPSGP